MSDARYRSGADETASVGDNSIDRKKLTSFVERIERLEEEKKALGDDVKDVYGEAAATGFDKKILRKAIALCRVEKEKREAEATVLGLYLHALGML